MKCRGMLQPGYGGRRALSIFKQQKSYLFLIGLVAMVILFGIALVASNINLLKWHHLTIYVSSGNKPQPNASVKVRPMNIRMPIAIGRADEEGLASFTLPKGRYIVRAEYKAFALQLSPAFGEQPIELKSDMKVEIAVRGGM